jgi:signal transduction histidine kinase
MGRVSVIAGSAFRAALYSVAVFLGILALGAGLTYQSVRRSLIEDLQAHTLTARSLLLEVHAAGGRDASLDSVRTLSTRLGARRQVIAVYDGDGTLLAGNIDVRPVAEGWQELSSPAFRDAVGYPDISVIVSRLDDLTLVIGRTLETEDRVLGRLLGSLAGLALLVTIALFGIGSVLSRRAGRKLDAMAATLDRVARGEMDARLPVNAGVDNIDQVAVRMNLHLDRLAALVATTRSTASALAHDLRTPLARATLAVERAAARAGDAAAQDALAAAETELASLAATFDTILRIVRIGAETPLDGAQVDAAALLADLAESFAPLAEDSGLDLRLALPAGLPAIRGDEAMLRQMLVNLIGNALAHCPPGTILTLSAEPVAPSRVALVVADSGPGIPEPERTRVTELFYRLDRSRTTEGSGLGLALVKAIASRHGGSLSLLDNRPGLRAVVDLPAAR